MTMMMLVTVLMVVMVIIVVIMVVTVVIMVVIVFVIVLVMVLVMVRVMGAGNGVVGDGTSDCGKGGARAGTVLEMLLSPKCQCTDMQIFCKWCAKQKICIFSTSFNIITMNIAKIH
jgi:hypothetical protein